MKDRETYLKEAKADAEAMFDEFVKNRNVKFKSKSFGDIIEKIVGIQEDKAKARAYDEFFHGYDYIEGTVIDDDLYLNLKPLYGNFIIAEYNRFFNVLNRTFRKHCNVGFMVKVLFRNKDGKRFAEYVATGRNSLWMNKSQLDAFIGRRIAVLGEPVEYELKRMDFSDYWRILKALADNRNYYEDVYYREGKHIRNGVLEKLYDSFKGEVSVSK